MLNNSFGVDSARSMANNGHTKWPSLALKDHHQHQLRLSSSGLRVLITLGVAGFHRQGKCWTSIASAQPWYGVIDCNQHPVPIQHPDSLLDTEAGVWFSKRGLCVSRLKGNFDKNRTRLHERPPPHFHPQEMKLSISGHFALHLTYLSFICAL